MDGYGSVGFLANYNTSTPALGGHGTCGAGGFSYSASGNTLYVTIPSGGVLVPASVPDSVSFGYALAPNGTWFFQDTASAGWAFAYSACVG